MVKGKIVLVPFPFDNLSSSKVRPAVCLTNPMGKYNHVILALITSKILTNLEDTDYVIDRNHPDFVPSGLHKSSTIKSDHVMTVRTSIIQRELEQLSSNTQKEIVNKLCLLLSKI